jgi:hypothetical protein
MIPAAMGRLGCALVTLLLAGAAGGCGGDAASSSTEVGPPATPTATPKSDSAASPVAYRLKTTAARALAGTEAARVIERRGRVVARSTWDGYQAVVLSEWLQQRELRAFYERFTGEQSAEAGEAMLDWLRVFRVALRNADPEHVVIIPVPD